MYRFSFTVLLFVAASLSVCAAPDSMGKVKESTGQHNDYKYITHQVCDSIHSDKEKAKAIYNWIATHVAYDVYGLLPGAENSRDPNTVIQEGSAVCMGYSILFGAMCTEAGIRTINISGYTKDAIFDKGDKLYIPRHMWSALLIDGKWQMADVTWGAGFVKPDTTWWRKLVHNVTGRPVRKTNMKFVWQYERKWLLQDPLEFRYTHLPAYPPFQFTDTAMPISVFEQGDSAIRAFNAISHSIDNSDELMRLSSLGDTDIQTLFAADIYKFNNRFALAAAIDYNMQAIAVIDSIKENTDVAVYKARVAAAYDLMTKSRDMVNEQSVLTTGQYNTLKSKNMRKYSDAMDYFRNLYSSARRMTNEMTRYQKASEHIQFVYQDVRREYVRVAKYTDTIPRPRWRRLDITSRWVYDSLYTIITDSINERKTRLADITGSESVLSRLQYNINYGNEQLGNLVRSLEYATTLISAEAQYRLYLQDNLDEGAGKYYQAMKQLKNREIDSAHYHYLQCYDSVIAITRENIVIQEEHVATCQRILNDMQWLVDKTRPDSALTTTYSLWANDMMDCSRRFVAALDASTNFVKGINRDIATIKQQYAFIANMARAMQRPEKTRKDMEYKSILADQQRDMKDIAKFREHLKRSFAVLEAAKR
ncbi:hypothetical protein CJD36_012190 [Flavipsychrobacter stenotrophus]|uniref:Transglutaminase-like domain-containing protein n=1 Tax=Flavipsychrobacter stenotrophus TaxID=2077091 RepID=A0A2S7SVV0_9BACT|nr:transglutaminase domain-containing protein [Flavipsychrobacter stenotrophus]PQJ10725.1 hypothetical protein CJD36_012190 [Flavipsychrobacter stenotrophus]